MLRRMAAALACAALLAGCSGSPSVVPLRGPVPSGSASRRARRREAATPAVVPRAPRAKACYRLTAAQLTKPTNASTPVPCASRHTAQTIYVGSLDTVVDGHSVAVDSATVQKQLSTTCPRKLAAYVGGRPRARDLSRFNVVWYSPTLEQSDQGADWFRCDVIAFAAQDQLASLPGDGAAPGRAGLGRPPSTSSGCAGRRRPARGASSG